MIVTRGYGSGAIVTRGYSAASDYEFLEVFFRHIWPGKYDPLVVQAINRKFYFKGITFELDILAKSINFWQNGKSKQMYIHSLKKE